ncbi:hypothetical protein RRG08_061969 [Elysia crispata]|uniref:Uncharacterized protein n=1 Tax=Elysia crispata TaxID=231223 RepID=A0AAE1DGS7_9GAST|nr:hypothetical protein RRG08_061969 [Elysia crispata]
MVVLAGADLRVTGLRLQREVDAVIALTNRNRGMLVQLLLMNRDDNGNKSDANCDGQKADDCGGDETQR